jgi:hypothetical protein
MSNLMLGKFALENLYNSTLPSATEYKMDSDKGYGNDPAALFLHS